MKRCRLGIFLIGALLFLAPFCRAADAETQLKAVFLGRLAGYVELPGAVLPSFVITVLGANPFGDLLGALYRGKTIQGRPVELRFAASLVELGDTDLLYVALPDFAARQEAIDHAQKNGILSVGEARGFAESGGIVQINFVEQKARITINHAAAVKSGIRIGAPLLSIATVLRGEKP